MHRARAVTFRICDCARGLITYDEILSFFFFFFYDKEHLSCKSFGKSTSFDTFSTVDTTYHKCIFLSPYLFITILHRYDLDDNQISEIWDTRVRRIGYLLELDSGTKVCRISLLLLIYFNKSSYNRCFLFLFIFLLKLFDATK